MSRPTRPIARVTRLTPTASVLQRASGQRIPLGAQVADGERVTLLTPTGAGGTVTLDAAGVRLAVTMGRLPMAVEEAAAGAPPTPEKAPAVKAVVASSAGPASVEEVEAVRAALDNGEEEGK